MCDAARRKEPFEDQAVRECEGEPEEDREANEQEVAREAIERDEQHASQDERRCERVERFETPAEVACFEGEAKQLHGRAWPLGRSRPGEAKPSVDLVDVAQGELEPLAEDHAEPPTARDLEEDEALISD